MSDVRVGVIGVGALGRHHTRLYAESTAQLVGVTDVNAEQAATIASEYGCAVYESPAALAAAADAVSVAVPTDLHHQVVSELLDLGCHVLVEKPLAHSSGVGRALVEDAEAKGLVLAVGHVERFNPVITYLEDKIDRPRFIEAQRLAMYPPPRPGLLPRGTEVGVVLDLMIHDIDVILHLVRSDVEQIDAVGIAVLSPSEDIANARIRFANGCVANVTASRISQEPTRKIRVFQADAYLSLDYQEQSGEIVTRKGVGIEREAVPITGYNALERELADFISCVAATMRGEAGQHPQVTGEHGLQALEIAEEITDQIAAAADTDA
jgi:predicted dehydrogenase